MNILLLCLYPHHRITGWRWKIVTLIGESLFLLYLNYNLSLCLLLCLYLSLSYSATDVLCSDIVLRWEDYCRLLAALLGPLWYLCRATVDTPIDSPGFADVVCAFFSSTLMPVHLQLLLNRLLVSNWSIWLQVVYADSEKGDMSWAPGFHM